jgi:hypothetical protein
MGPLAPLFLSVLGCRVKIVCEEEKTRSLLAANFSLTSETPQKVDLDYVVGGGDKSSSFFLCMGKSPPIVADDEGEFLFLFEESLTLALQRLRSDLYFFHAAALEHGGKAYLLVAPSGSGKSTTTWALLHHGFAYMSDELGPVDLDTSEVHPYSHALCLKQEPPLGYPLPADVLRTTRTLHVPTGSLPSGVSAGPLPLAATFFVQYSPKAHNPTIQPLGKAEASIRLFANALNPLAHPGSGLDGSIKVATMSACFKLTTADLPSSCQLVRTAIAGL